VNTTTNVKVYVDDKEVRKTLGMLSVSLGERVRKKGARKALGTVRNKLQALWLSAMYRGKSPHRKAIAKATKVDVRRNGKTPGSPIIAEVGVVYGAKGGKGAKGRQRIWHLLEHGFRSHGSSNVYSNAPTNLREAVRERRSWIQAKRKEIFATIKGGKFEAKRARSKAMKEMYAAAREQWADVATYQGQKRETIERSKAAGSGRLIPGSKRSTRFIAANFQAIMNDISASVLAEAKQVLGGRNVS
jgi:hypothetical protein